jgi:hypothetical protein
MLFFARGQINKMGNLFNHRRLKALDLNVLFSGTDHPNDHVAQYSEKDIGLTTILFSVL